MQGLFGTTTGLKHAQIERLKRLKRRRVQPDQVVSPELAQSLCEISAEIRRQVGVLLNRKGQIEHVMVGDANRIMLPDVGRQRAGSSRLRGLRLVHTHLRGEELTRDDLADLSKLRLDMVVALGLTPEGRPGHTFSGHLVPHNPAGDLWRLSPAQALHELTAISFLDTIRALEEELARTVASREAGGHERVVVIQVRTRNDERSEASLHELRELCRTAGVHIVDEVIQRRSRPDQRFLVGRGKLEDIVLRALQLDADALVCDHDLSPGQTKTMGDVTELKIIDRTQLILDIFAQHARSRAGKLQVELAQLKYMLPRLAGRYTRLSRQGGGLGARGPGEKKLETDRRRMRERLHRLEKEINTLARQRAGRRSLRHANRIPVVAIVGYTNAGKSTLLNSLTRSDVRAENKLFATLDPTTRRLRFPQDRSIVLADTVGFIRDLPKELMRAFRATLEELEDADLLLHVADVADPDLEAQLTTVEELLLELELAHVPRLLVLNKADKLPAGEAEAEARLRGGLAISATKRHSTRELLSRLESRLWSEGLHLEEPPSYADGYGEAAQDDGQGDSEA